MRIALIKILLLLSLWVGRDNNGTVYGWSQEGHEKVASIAFDNLDMETRFGLMDLLHIPRRKVTIPRGDGASSEATIKMAEYLATADLKDWMTQSSSWADGDKATEDQSNHYVHIDVCTRSGLPSGLHCGEARVDGGLGGTYIISAIVRHIARAIDLRWNLPITFIDSIKYLIHYLGDIHQPMHVA